MARPEHSDKAFRSELLKKRILEDEAVKDESCGDEAHDIHVKVWDAPTRFFHWGIVCLMGSSWVSADNGWMRLHLWSGSALLTLLIFRIAWGVVGSTTARFSEFVTWPRTALAYLRALTSAKKPLFAGHNPAGGWMVLALIVALSVQVATGLLANDGIDFNGPLATLISKEASDRLTELHGVIFDIIMLLVWMHLVAVFFYLFVKGENLIWPMFTGRKHVLYVPPALNIRFTPLPIALLLIALSAVFVWWVIFS